MKIRVGAIKRLISAALCAALVLLSPGLECYAAFGDAFEAGAGKKFEGGDGQVRLPAPGTPGFRPGHDFVKATELTGAKAQQPGVKGASDSPGAVPSEVDKAKADPGVSQAGAVELPNPGPAFRKAPQDLPARPSVSSPDSGGSASDERLAQAARSDFGEGAAAQAKIFLTRHGQAPIAATLSTLGGILAAEPALKDDLNKNGKIRVVLAKSQPQAGLSEADLDALGAALRARGVTAKLETENILVDWQREGEKGTPGQAQGRHERSALWRLFAESLTKPTASEVLGGVTSKAFPFFVSMCTWALMYSGQKASLPAASFSVAYVQALWSGLLANIQQAVVAHPRALAVAIGLSFSLDTFHGIWINSWNNFQNALGRDRGLRYQTVFNFLYGQLWGVVFRSVAWSALPGVVPPWSPRYWKDVSLSAIIGTFFGTLGYQGLNTLYNNGRLSRQTRSGIQQVRDLFFMLAGTFFGAGSMKSFWIVFALQQSLDFSIYLASQHLQSRPILYIADDAVARTRKFKGTYPVSPDSASPDSPLKQALQGLLNSPFVKPFVWLVKKALGKTVLRPGAGS